MDMQTFCNFGLILYSCWLMTTRDPVLVGMIRCEATTVIKMSQMSVCTGISEMCTACTILHFRGIDGIVDLSIVSVSWALQLGPKIIFIKRNIFPQKLWTVFWRAFLRFSQNPNHHFWNSWYSHIQDFHHSQIYYTISNILWFPVCTYIGILYGFPVY